LVANSTTIFFASTEYYTLPTTISACSLPSCDAGVTFTTEDYWTSLAINSTHLYWTQELDDGGTGVLRCPQSGCNGAPATAAGTAAAVGLIAVDDSHLYWVDRETIKSCPASGCSAAPSVFYKETDPIYGFAIDATTAYWCRGESVVKCALSGCTDPTVLGAGDDWCRAVYAPPGPFIYWQTESTIFQVTR
jgi:hypothetical protein